MEITAYCHRLAVFAAMKQSQRVLTKKMLMVMKLTAIILLAAFLHVSARGLSQMLTITLKNAPLEKVFSEIQKQTGYSFFYEDGLLKNAKPVDITVVKASIVQVLDICFANQPFTYKIVNNAISVKKKELAIESAMQLPPASSDPVTISGKVTDPQGNPLVGANVKVKGTNIGTTTDNQGRFTLDNLDENAILEISFVGHDPQTFQIKGKPFLTISLNQKQSILDETVVIAYGTSSRRVTTGNIATVKAADIEKQPVQNPLLSLQGRVPGIEIRQLSGMNGGGVTVRIQGRNSFRFNGLEPFIVIDGVPYPYQQFTTPSPSPMETIVQGGSPLNYINPADIESIEILKDADATAIYGSRAGNGAILITTKKGKAGKTKMSINVQQGWGKIIRRADMMNTKQYLDMRNEALKNDGLKPSSVPNATAPNLYAPDLTIWDTTRYTDWQKELIGETAKYTNINTSISGGTSAVQYLIGATYNRQTTVFPGDFDDKKSGLHFTLNSSSVNSKFRVQLSGNYMYNQNHLPGVDLTQSAVLLEPNAPPLYNENGTLNWAPNAAGRSTWINPLATTYSRDFTNDTKNLVTNVNLSYSIFPGLDIGSSLGYTNLQNDLYMPSRVERTPPEDRATSNRISQFGKRNMSSWVIEPQLTYKRNIGNIKMEGLFGASWQKSNNEFLQVTGFGYSNDQLMKSPLAATTKTISAAGSAQYKYNAVFGRLNGNWSDRYLMNLTLRRDGSSRFGDKNKFHNFGSIGLGWIFSEERFIKQRMPFLSFGKLRGSLGTTGNDQIGDYAYISTYSISNLPIPYQNGTGLQVLSLPNPQLQWEETLKWQGGIDLGFIKDRIILGVVYAQNRSSNQIILNVLPSITGFSGVTQNIEATIRNLSWEFTLNTVNIKGRNFTWTSNINLTIPQNRVVKFPGIEKTAFVSGDYGVIIGHPVDVLKLYRYASVDPASGKYMVFDKSGNPTFDPDYEADRTALVSNVSKFYGGFLNSISFKRFQLDFLFQFVNQNGIRDFFYWNGSTVPGRFSSGISNQPISVLNRWQKQQDNKPIGRFTNNIGNLPMWPVESDVYYMSDASYIRLKNLSLSWQLPPQWLQKAKLQGCLLYFRGENLVTITNYSGMDPETQSSTTMPPLQMWTVGIKLDL
ncbi:SusC/RagA family TonB-linked outer membrane protein [Niastella caeni]|uniref:SusC/RagA family TonB-linked outer membrane protein n=1 Tax=Niastella caeni TaxID=2569763 RepID=A0A4S8HV85_9BACT|nr:SusC/RagA family TonB-linked outer membrane protein [Niastella caeni]THU39500.1 SusC/RagA family TonB-linked outer membrane protein [Niastella caeni]